MQPNFTVSDFLPHGTSSQVVGGRMQIVIGGASISFDLNCSAHEINNATILLGAFVDKTRRRRRGPATRYPEVLPMGAKGRLLSVEIEDYLFDLRGRKKATQTLKGYAHSLKLLLAVAGDVPVDSIKHPTITKFFNEVPHYPRNAGSKKEFKGMTGQEILAIGIARSAGKPIKDKTLDSHAKNLNVFFETLILSDAIHSSPMTLHNRDSSSKTSTKTRHPLTSEQLQKIFDPKTFVPWAGKYPHRWWIPQIALYTGARVEEIAQLRAADIREDHGVMCFALQIVEEDAQRVPGMRGKRFKCEESLRTIPIAQPLIDAGFLRFVQDIRNKGLTRLFPHLKAGRDRKTGELNGAGYSTGMIQQFAKYLKTNTDLKEGMGTHAFRHTISSALDDLDKPGPLIGSITGHAESKWRVPTLADYITKDQKVLRPKQVEALADFKPQVELPRYRSGQFEQCLANTSRHHP